MLIRILLEQVLQDDGRFLRATVAIDAFLGRGVAGLSVEVSVTVHIGEEVAIHAMHAHLEVNVLEMHRHVGRRGVAGLLPLVGDGSRQLFGVDVLDLLPVMIQQVAARILLVHRAEHPPVPVKIGELRVLELRVDIGVRPLKELLAGNLA